MKNDKFIREKIEEIKKNCDLYLSSPNSDAFTDRCVEDICALASAVSYAHERQFDNDIPSDGLE